MSTTDSKRHWTSYWRSGALTSLPQDFAGNYGGETAHFWKKRFEALPAGGRMLDLCTGNGPIPFLAAEHARSRGAGDTLRIEAVDAAEMDPKAAAEAHPEIAELLPAIRFRGSIDLEQWEGPDSPVDLISSQYGIEYTDTRQLATRIGDWLVPGGELAIISHAADSDILQSMETEATAHAILQRSGFLRALRNWMAGELTEGRFRRTLSRASATLMASQHKRHPLLVTMARHADMLLSMDSSALKQAHDGIAALRRDVIHGRRRMEDLLAVQQKLARNPEWYRDFEYAGLELIERGSLWQDGSHRSGDYIRFRQPSV